MLDVLRKDCVSLIIAPTGVGKTYLLLNLLETSLKGWYEYIIIICPSLKRNETYLSRKWVWVDDGVILIDKFDRLEDVVECLGDVLEGFRCLFVLDDCICDDSFGMKRSKLVELAISGRHNKHSLCILTQIYSAVSKNIRRQVKWMIFWKLKESSDLKLINDETNVFNIYEVTKKMKHLGKNSFTYVDLDNDIYKICLNKI